MLMLLLMFMFMLFQRDAGDTMTICCVPSLPFPYDLSGCSVCTAVLVLRAAVPTALTSFTALALLYLCGNRLDLCRGDHCLDLPCRGTLGMG